MDGRIRKYISRGLWAIALALAVWVLFSSVLAGPPQSVVLEAIQPADERPEVPRLDMNQATLEQLDELPGIGPALARRILDAREDNGPFAGPEDILAVSGIGPAIYEAIEPYITF